MPILILQMKMNLNRNKTSKQIGFWQPKESTAKGIIGATMSHIPLIEFG